MKPRIDGLRVVAFNPKPQPAPPAVDTANPLLRKLTLLQRLEPGQARVIERVVDRLLRGYTSQERQRRNIGKPVIDLTGDDREGA